MRKRTRARELALQFLYQLDVSGEESMPHLGDFLDEETKDGEVQKFARVLVQGAWEHREASDALITTIAKNWEVHRMAAIDRNVLRLAVYELRMPEAAPPKVVINEAIELGKKFSTQHSGKFINGILDKAKEALIASGELAAASSDGAAAEGEADGIDKAAAP
jgi:transcription antitermination factor NusB